MSIAFGPCPENVIKLDVGKVRGGTSGCINQTPAAKGEQATGGDLIGNGYPDPNTNLLGYMIYDGPPLIFHDRFVNFKDKIIKDKTGNVGEIFDQDGCQVPARVQKLEQAYLYPVRRRCRPGLVPQ